MNPPIPPVRLIRSDKFQPTMVREHLAHHRKACAGFSLGQFSWETMEARFDFPLVAVTFADWFARDYDTVFPRMAAYHKAALRTATASGRSVIGLWAAWETDWQGHIHHQRQGCLVDLAKALDLPFVCSLTLEGGEPLWSAGFWMVNRFPHPNWSAIRSKEKSDEARDNPRRIRAEWRRQATTDGLALP